MSGFLKYLLLFSLPVVALVLLVFCTPLDKQFAYSFVEGDCSGHGKWIHDRIHENEQPIDVAIIGTSVGWGLFDDHTLSKMLSDHKGKKINVANLSYCRPGFNMRTLVIEEVISAKKPQHIIIELRWEPSSGGHPIFGYLATHDMLHSPPTLLYQPYPLDLLKALTVRWEQLKTNLYPEKSYRADTSPYGVGRSTVMVDQQFMHRFLLKRQKEEPFPKETIQNKIHYYVYWKNLEYISDLCKKENIRLSFCYVNHYGRSTAELNNEEKIENLATVWYPPDSIFQNPAYYSDIVHFNVDGTDAITPFLFEKLSEYDY